MFYQKNIPIFISTLICLISFITRIQTIDESINVINERIDWFQKLSKHKFKLNDKNNDYRFEINSQSPTTTTAISTLASTTDANPNFSYGHWLLSLISSFESLVKLFEWPFVRIAILPHICEDSLSFIESQIEIKLICRSITSLIVNKFEANITKIRFELKELQQNYTNCLQKLDHLYSKNTVPSKPQVSTNAEGIPIQSLPQTNQIPEDSTIREFNTSAFNTTNHLTNDLTSQLTNTSTQSPHPSIGPSPQPSPLHHSPHNPMSRAIMLEGDFEFLRYLSDDELRSRMSKLYKEMVAITEELKLRSELQAIIDAKDNKKKRQQN